MLAFYIPLKHPLQYNEWEKKKSEKKHALKFLQKSAESRRDVICNDGYIIRQGSSAKNMNTKILLISEEYPVD